LSLISPPNVPIGLLRILMMLAALDNAWFVATALGGMLIWLLWSVIGQASQSTAALVRMIGYEGGNSLSSKYSTQE
jgi:hypothetical protein